MAFNIRSFELQSHDRLIGSWVTMILDAYKAKPLPRSEVIQDESQSAGVFLCVDRRVWRQQPNGFLLTNLIMKYFQNFPGIRCCNLHELPLGINKYTLTSFVALGMWSEGNTTTSGEPRVGLSFTTMLQCTGQFWSRIS
jgi:hypothetical protein